MATCDGNRTKAKPAAELNKGKGKAAKAKPAPQPGRWLDRDCNAALDMQRIGESRWRPLELCYWPDQGALPAKGKEYPGLRYKRLRDKPPKAQQLQQPAEAYGSFLTHTAYTACQHGVATPLQVAVLNWDQPDEDILAQPYDWVLATQTPALSANVTTSNTPQATCHKQYATSNMPQATSHMPGWSPQGSLTSLSLGPATPFLNLVKEVADQVGIPGLRIQQGMAAGGESTGALVWSAGIRLASHLQANRADLLRGARVLELGSGTGIVGITCAALGAHVLLTDKEDMVGSTTENVNANAAIIEAAGGSTQVCGGTAVHMARGVVTPLQVAVLNWDQPDEDILAQPYDWVLAADVTYEPAALEHLAGLMSRLVSANPDSMVKLAHRYRSSALDKTMRETFNGYGLVLRPVDVRSTATAGYVDPIKAEEAIVFYRVLPM
ncbi:hypothetical protein QJQ45_026888 [Haematococcus lacustris]|nr:hypothetical protein QJQ45_026888 [Haematococcus lacustris]